MGLIDLVRAKRYTNEQLNKLPDNGPGKKLTFDNGILSLPADVISGQVSEARFFGRTLVNLLSNVGNCESVSNFVASQGTAVLDPNNKTVGNNSILTTVNASNNMSLRTPLLNLDTSKYYIGLADIKNNNALNVCFRFWNGVENIGTSTYTGTSFATRYFKISPTNFKTSQFIYFDVYGAVGQTGNVDAIRVYEITAEEYAKIDVDPEWTGEKLAQKYPYVDGTKSTLPVKVKSVGKNLFDGKIELGFIDIATGQPVVATRIRSKNFTRLNVGQSYKISSPDITINYNELRLFFYDSNFNFVTSSISNTSFTANYPYVKFGYTLTSDVNTKFQLEKGTTTTEYEPYKLSQAYIPEVGGSVDGVRDEVRLTPNGWEKVQGVSEYTILNGSNVTQSVTRTNVQEIRFSVLPNAKAGTTSIDNLVDIMGKTEIPWADTDTANAVGKFYYGAEMYVRLFHPLGTFATLVDAKSYYNTNPLTLTYQLATPVVTKLPPQPPLRIFEGGTIYIEPVGDPAETTLPVVELTVPVGASNNFGIASRDYQAAVADWILSTQESRCLLLVATNAGGTANIIAPDKPGLLYAVNNKSGQIITIKKPGGTGVAIATGKTAQVMHNGTDYIKISGEV